jgi:hypothetical protein
MTGRDLDEDALSSQLEKKLLEFIAEHPELEGELGLWMASAATLESTNPEQRPF